MTRIALGGIVHETNTFVPIATGLNDFRAYHFVQGPNVITIYDGTGTELGGAIQEARRAHVDLVPLLFASAVPSGTVTTEAFENLRDRIVTAAAGAGRLDAAVLVLHGAMVAEGYDDAEAVLLAALREVLGDAPLAVTLDLHANLSLKLREIADVLVGYRTYPHVDTAQRGAEALRLALRMIRTGMRPESADEKLPLLVLPLAQGTDDEPMRSLTARCAELASGRSVWTASLFPGFPYSDVDRLGFSVYVGADADAREEARQLAEHVWNRRQEFTVDLVDPEEAVRKAGTVRGPVVLADAGDNVGGGSPGDGTLLLRMLEDRAGRDGLVLLWDPQAIEEIYTSLSTQMPVEVGGRTPLTGPPARIQGQVRRCGRVTYQRAGSYMPGQRVDMGRVAVIESAAGHVVVTEHRIMPFDDRHVTVLGLHPRDYRILVAKSAIAWKAAFGAYASEALLVNTPGSCPADLNTLRFSRRPHPLYPLDPVEGIPQGKAGNPHQPRRHGRWGGAGADGPPASQALCEGSGADGAP